MTIYDPSGEKEADKYIDPQEGPGQWEKGEPGMVPEDTSADQLADVSAPEAGQPFTPPPEHLPPPQPPPPPEPPGFLVTGPDVRPAKTPGLPGRFVFADMSGVIAFVWLPVGLMFFLPFNRLFGNTLMIGDLQITHFIVGLGIAIIPWFVLLNHLRKGRLWDGIIDMFLWAIWECIAVITLCYLYPDQAEQVIYRASDYWKEMHGWLRTGEGNEADPVCRSGERLG